MNVKIQTVVALVRKRLPRASDADMRGFTAKVRQIIAEQDEEENAVIRPKRSYLADFFLRDGVYTLQFEGVISCRLKDAGDSLEVLPPHDRPSILGPRVRQADPVIDGIAVTKDGYVMGADNRATPHRVADLYVVEDAEVGPLAFTYARPGDTCLHYNARSSTALGEDDFNEAMLLREGRIQSSNFYSDAPRRNLLRRAADGRNSRMDIRSASRRREEKTCTE